MSRKTKKYATSQGQTFSVFIFFLKIKGITKWDDFCKEKGGHQASVRVKSSPR